MIVAGIDVGSKNTKIVALRDGEVAVRVTVSSGFDQEESARVGLEKAAAELDIGFDDFAFVAATGVGRKAIAFAGHLLTEVAADARGAAALDPEARTVIDVGADEARAIRVDEGGKVLDFAVNEKCAAGAGAFVEAMSRALEVSLKEFGEISLESTESIPMNAQCTVFAESEVVSLIHSNTAPKDIARAVHDAMAGRVSAMVRRAGVQGAVVIGGGVAHNVGFVQALKDTLGVAELRVLPQPEYLGALGAALAAADKAGDKAGEGARVAGEA
ncbi:MAG: CoA activase [Actinobacteria bacterium]|nr:CoA activase [Actinomycetota bacterium]